MATHTSEEIDLGYLYRKSKSGIRRMNRGIVRTIDFYLRNWIVVLVLIIIGVALGFVKDRNKTIVYNNKALVIPNVENADYLYDKISAIDSKIKSGDTLFLKEIFKDDFKAIRSVKIEPVVDLYNFVEKSRNLDVVRIFGQNKDLKDYAENIVTSKNYKYHSLDVKIKGFQTSPRIIQSLMDYLNSNEHFQEYLVVYKELKNYELKEYQQMIRQADSLIRANGVISSADVSGVSVNTTANVHYLLNVKTELIDHLYTLSREVLDYTDPIKLVNVDYNIKEKRLLSFSNKVIYPVLLIFLFSMVFLIRYAYLRMKEGTK